MPDIKAAVIRGSVPHTVTGQFDIKRAGLGWTPKAVMTLLTNANSDGLQYPVLQFNIGFASVAAQRSTVTYDRYNAGSIGVRRGVTDKTMVLEKTAVGVSTEVERYAFIADGTRFNTTYQEATAFSKPVTTIVFGGDDLQVQVGTATLGAQNVATGIATTFEPDLLLVAGHGAPFDDSETIHSLMSFGMVHNGATVKQKAVGCGEQDAVSTTQCGSLLWSDSCCGQVTWAAEAYRVEAGAFSATGFDFTVRDGDSYGDEIQYLALGGGITAFLGEVAFPTTGGNHSVTGTGFIPQLAMEVFSYHPSFDTHETSFSGFMIGAADGTEEGSAAYQSKDNSTAYESQMCCTDDSLILQYTTSEAVDKKATFVSFDANGWTRYWSPVSAAVRKGFVLAIKTPSMAVNLAAGIGDGAAEGLGCTAAIGQSFTAGAADGSSEGLGGGLAVGASLAAATGEASGDRLSCSAAVGGRLAAGAGDTAGSGLACAAAIGARFTTGVGDGSAEGLSATVDTGSHAAALTAGIGDSSGAGLAAAAAVGASLSGGLTEASGEGLGATTAAGVSFTAAIGEATTAGQAATFRAGGAFSAGPGEGGGGALSVAASIGGAFMAGLDDAVALGLGATAAVGARLAAGLSEGFGLGLTTTMDGAVVEPFLVDAMHYSSTGFQIARSAGGVAAMRSAFKLGAAK